MDGSSGDNRYYRVIIFSFLCDRRDTFRRFFAFFEFWLTIFISGDIIFYVKGEDGEK